MATSNDVRKTSLLIGMNYDQVQNSLSSHPENFSEILLQVSASAKSFLRMCHDSAIFKCYLLYGHCFLMFVPGWGSSIKHCFWRFHPGNPLTNGPCFKATRVSVDSSFWVFNEISLKMVDAWQGMLGSLEADAWKPMLGGRCLEADAWRPMLGGRC